MFDEFNLDLFGFVIGDLAIWYGLYYLCARSHICNAEKSERKPRLMWFSIGFLAVFLMVHAFWINMGIELARWGGPD